MEIQVLGGLSAQLSTRPLRLGTPKQQAIFAMLAVHPGRVVTVDELIDELWADRPPRSAVANVRTYAANLRRGFPDRPRRHLAPTQRLSARGEPRTGRRPLLRVGAGRGSLCPDAGHLSGAVVPQR
ncbi:AfsR/SARP family transcriptional regulator [Micromonospora tarensis]|uniref:Winged helix-turn-helix domain-containing protein n=1 Tax=Micromonospora tarensis TaxID=2806100 RepID=A0ABS1YFH4_9ACTN|nr:winged helix-turn-helix domain-containing protein [Micromonospora tarensis]